MWAASLASRTTAGYQSGWNSWFDFCSKHNLQCLPASEAALMSFVAFRSSTVVPGTIRRYLAAVVERHTSAGLASPMTTRIKRMLKGLDAILDVEVRRKLPITGDMLRSWAPRFSDSWADRTMWCAFVVAFGGLLRSAELFALELRDIAWATDGSLTLSIRSSKTSRKPTKVRLHRIANSVFCPISALSQMLCMRNARAPFSVADRSFPLFWLPSKGGANAFKYEAVVSVIRHLCKQDGLDEMDYCTHSFRRGAATTLRDMDVPEDVIQRLGRWKSLTVRIYANVRKHKVSAAARALQDSSALDDEHRSEFE